MRDPDCFLAIENLVRSLSSWPPNCTMEPLLAEQLVDQERIKRAMIELGPTRDVLADCYAYGEPARRYVEILQLGLPTLAGHYRMT